MQTYLSWLAGALVVILLTVGTAHTDDLFDGDDVGPVETTTEEGTDETGPEEQISGWEDLNEEVWGPAARTEEYLPHDACDRCFTLPNYSPYQINEYVESDVEGGAIIIAREIPNPAPEVMEREDYDPEIGGYYDPETGERVWFIGKQEIVGPTDEEKWSPHLPVSTIEMKRIKARHLDKIFSIPGVNSFGIGTHGFVVGVSPHTPESRDLVPEVLEGIPVQVTTRGLAVLHGHEEERIRPLRSGLSIGRGWTWGTLGPHTVRDTDTASGGVCCQMLSLTAAHVLNPSNSASSWEGRATYSPGMYDTLNNWVGSIDYVFHLRSCGVIQQDPDTDTLYAPSTCSGSSGSNINEMNTRPDIGLVSYGWKSVPLNDPEGAEPIRQMQYRATKWVRGPSGRTKMAKEEHKHKVWGAVTGAHATGRVTEVDECANFITEAAPGEPVYRYCGVNLMNYRTRPGDSGATVAYKGEGHHDIAGMVVGGTEDTEITYYIPANSISDALSRVDRGVSYYWGTAEAKWRPATDDGDD